MSVTNFETITKPTHSWWQRIGVAFVPGPMTPLLEETARGLLEQLQKSGNEIQEIPGPGTNIILTTSMFGVPLRWREAILFTARRRFGMEKSPTVFTLVHATPIQLRAALDNFEQILKKSPPDPQDYAFPGLGPNAYETLYEQGRRGGPMLSLLRMVQTQAMSIRIILVVGEEHSQEAYTFDLVGAHPRTAATDRAAFFEDLAGRMVTAVSTKEVTDHQVTEDAIPNSLWKQLDTPLAMRRAGHELGLRDFFTEMVKVSNLAVVPSLPDSIASQYSEGCFATWDPRLEGLVTTVTGSARPVDKGNLTDDELSVIVGVRSNEKGAIVRHVEGKRNDPPSSEAVELIQLDSALPRIEWQLDGGLYQVPVARSKLHGHRGVQAYDPHHVEHVYLDQPYYHFPVSCSTEAQASAIKSAFSRSEALQNPDDPRKVVFTVLPGHGIVIVEKWVPGKEPFQVMWEYMDAGSLQIENAVPQGLLAFQPGPDSLMKLQMNS